MFTKYSPFNETRNDESGFTLLELLMATVVFGIVVSIAFPPLIETLKVGDDRLVETKAITAINAIDTYELTHAGTPPQSLDETTYKNFDENISVDMVVNGYNVCVMAWNKEGGDYTPTHRYTVLNGNKVDECGITAEVVPTTPTAKTYTPSYTPAQTSDTPAATNTGTSSSDTTTTTPTEESTTAPVVINLLPDTSGLPTTPVQEEVVTDSSTPLTPAQVDAILKAKKAKFNK